MDTEKDKQNNKAQWQIIQDLFDGEESCKVRPFHDVLDNFRLDLESHPYVRGRYKNNAGENPRRLRLLRKLTFPTAGLAAASILIAFIMFSSPKLTWAQVVQCFAQAEFMHASIYTKENGLSTPEQIELWMGRGTKVRIRMGDQLIFAEKGKVLAAFDLKTRKQIEPGQMAVMFTELIGSDDMFSMDTVIRGLSGGRKVPDKTPVLNDNAVISEDLAVFDLDFKESNDFQWYRIWALRKSGLPIRIRVWDPSDAASVDVFIDYSKPQSEMFFDPKAFAAALASIKTDQLNLAYLYLKDPGGKIYAPGIADEHEAMSIVTTTIDGEPFDLAHYRDKNLLLYFWDRNVHGRRWTTFKTFEEQYGSNDNLEMIVIATEKNEARVREFMDTQNITVPVLYEPGKGMYNTLARALGVKYAGETWLITGGKTYRVQDGMEKMIDLVCNGLNFENKNRLHQFITFQETTKDRILTLCGEPDKIETIDGRELWIYRFDTSADGLYTGSVTLRFNEEGKCSGHSSGGRLIEPSSLSIELSEAFWEENVEAVFGRENMPGSNSDYHIEILIGTGKGGGDILGGGHPRTEIVPGKKYDREVPAGTYSIQVRLMNHNNTYTQMKETDILEQMTVGKSESVGIYFGDSDQPEITRAAYTRGQIDNAAKSREFLLKKPDYKTMLEDAKSQEDKYDDPKLLPWQLHLKEIAGRYENRSLPEKMELMPKGTDESYALKMMPKNLPGCTGYSAVSIEGDLKSRFLSHPFGPGVMRWPDETPSVEMNHDLVYRDGVSSEQKYTFILKQMGYEIEKITEQRKVYIATYDGRKLPNPRDVSAPNPAGWAWFTARSLIDSLTRTSNQDHKADGPVFIDETNLSAQPAPGQSYKDIAITMEMPSFTTQSFEELRPWFKDTFGISFVEETRPMEILVVRKAR